MASSSKKLKVEAVEPVDVGGKSLYHLGEQIMMFIDNYNQKDYIRIVKYDESRTNANIYPTKAGITISNPEGLDLLKKIITTKFIQDRYKNTYEILKEQLIEKKREKEGESSNSSKFFN